MSASIFLMRQTYEIFILEKLNIMIRWSKWELLNVKLSFDPCGNQNQKMCPKELDFFKECGRKKLVPGITKKM